MQKKPKKPIKKIGKFIREVSVVVIGIAIAVSINGWISNRSERNNVDAFLQAVRMELETNLELLEGSNRAVILPAVRYTRYLESLRGQPANPDSIRYHLQNVIHNHDGIHAITHAFEMLKFSGYMRLIDPNLQLAIWHTYSTINGAVQFSEQVSNMRWEEIRRHNLWQTASDEELVENPPLYDFYVLWRMHTILVNAYRNVQRTINATLTKF